MNKAALVVSLILCVLAGPLHAMELNDIQSSDQLARFIYEMIIEKGPVRKLLWGIESPETLKISDYKVAIPVKEIFGTIVEEIFAEELDAQLSEQKKKYNVREICAFRDSQDIVWRFQIIIFENRQYKIMKDFLLKLAKD